MNAGGRIGGRYRDRRRAQGGSWRTGAGIALELGAGGRALDRGPGSNSGQDRGRWVWVLRRSPGGGLGAVILPGGSMRVCSWAT